MEWTDLEIQHLHMYLQQNMSLSNIAKKLSRSRNAVVQAARKIVFQQLLYHDPSVVAENYNTTVADLRRYIVPSKFYVPVQSHPIPNSVVMFLTVLFAAGITRFGAVLTQNWSK